MALSPLEKAKRAFVSLLLLLARARGLALGISCESPDPAVLTAFKHVSRKVHPDRGGSLAESQRLNAARDAWDEARRRPQGPGRPTQQQREGATSGEQVLLPTVSASKGGFRIHSVAVLLTYQGFNDCAQWGRFAAFVSRQLRQWKVKHWCATLETNADGKYHAHVMLRFPPQQDCLVKKFAFEGLTPNAQTNDLCGDGLCKKKLQQSIDRGSFRKS